ncbi:hypothetical protein CDAR_298601 [Caerostris darwini]|uniref:Uncharacterized protein n=1 Tax=Caerostris darwini TaxID=1538125 RepID=A0AAV4MSR0_9ARAC|nr:hypothetical protein CDAR_298601 [Caerostris darwini]
MRPWTSLNSPDTLVLLPKSKQVTSGILVSVRYYLTKDIKIIKDMGNMGVDLRLSGLLCGIPEGLLSFMLFAFRTISQNSINYASQTKQYLSAHSPRWSNRDTNTAGREVLNLLNSNPLDFVYKSSDPQILLHYSVSRMNMYSQHNEILSKSQFRAQTSNCHN